MKEHYFYISMCFIIIGIFYTFMMFNGGVIAGISYIVAGILMIIYLILPDREKE